MHYVVEKIKGNLGEDLGKGELKVLKM